MHSVPEFGMQAATDILTLEGASVILGRDAREPSLLNRYGGSNTCTQFRMLQQPYKLSRSVGMCCKAMAARLETLQQCSRLRW